MTMKYILMTLFLVSCSSGVKKETEVPVASATDTGAPVEEAKDEVAVAKAADTKEVAAPTHVVDSKSSDELREKQKQLMSAAKNKNEAEVNRLSQELLTRDGDDIATLNAVGVYYYNIGRFDMARLIFSRAIKTNPNSSTMHNNMGILLLAEGEDNDAILSFKKALQLDIKNNSAAANLGSLHTKYKNYRAALPLLEQAYNAKAAELRVGTNYANALYRTGNVDGAIKVLDKITSAYPADVTSQLNYALYLYESKLDLEKASKLIAKIKFLSTENDVLRVVNPLSEKVERELKQSKQEKKK